MVVCLVRFCDEVSGTNSGGQTIGADWYVPRPTQFLVGEGHILQCDHVQCGVLVSVFPDSAVCARVSALLQRGWCSSSAVAAPCGGRLPFVQYDDLRQWFEQGVQAAENPALQDPSGLKPALAFAPLGVLFVLDDDGRVLGFKALAFGYGGMLSACPFPYGIAGWLSTSPCRPCLVYSCVGPSIGPWHYLGSAGWSWFRPIR